MNDTVLLDACKHQLSAGCAIMALMTHAKLASSWRPGGRALPKTSNATLPRLAESPYLSSSQASSKSLLERCDAALRMRLSRLRWGPNEPWTLFAGVGMRIRCRSKA
jgi:hypothetical protein